MHTHVIEQFLEVSRQYLLAPLIHGGRSSVGRVRGCDPRGRRFEPGRLSHCP